MSVKTKLYSFLCLFIIFTTIALVIVKQNNYTTTQIAHTSQQKLNAKEHIAQNHLKELSQVISTINTVNVFENFNKRFTSNFKEEGVYYYIYKNDSLCFWSDNEPNVSLSLDKTIGNFEIIKLRNGWFECVKQKINSDTTITLFALIAIKAEYDYENNYLSNNFSSWLDIPENTKLITPVKYYNHSVKSINGHALFEIYRTNGLYISDTLNFYAAVFSLLSIICLSLCLFFLARVYIRNKLLRILLLLSVAFLARTLMILYKVPNCFYATDLYNVRIFGNASSFYFAFLGDFFINSFLLFINSIYLYVNRVKINSSKSYLKYLIILIITLFLMYSVYNFPLLIFSLINNSTVSFNINQLFDLSYYTIIGLSSIVFFIFSFYVMLEIIILELIDRFNNKLLPSLLIILLIAVFATILYVRQSDTLIYFWFVPLFIACYLLRQFKATNNFINVGAIILIATFITSYFFNSYNQINKQHTYDALSYTIADREDAIAENEILKINTAIKNDTKLKNLFSLLPLSNQTIEQTIKQVNFSGYFERYDVVLSLFKKNVPIFPLADTKYLDASYFENLMNEGRQTMNENLFFIDKKNNPIKYVGKINITDINLNIDSVYTLYFQLAPKLASNAGVFPDILLDKSLQSKIESKKISYALYENKKLQSSYGVFQYPILYNKFSINNSDTYFDHYYYTHPNSITIIVSDLKTDFWQLFASNSYLFIFFSFIVICSVWFNSVIIKKNFRFNSLNNRIQFILVSIITVSLLAVVFGTIWVVTKQFETKNKTDLILKSKSILIELKQSVGQQTELDASYKEYTTFSLKKLAQLFGTDITLFDEKGELYATSQPAIFEQGLVSKLMNPIAYAGFLQNKMVTFSNIESIGSLNYLSTYIPFYNSNNVLLGYLNLPYFSKQKDLEKELSAYLTTLLNIYTILFVVSTLISLFVSNLFTKPLRIIKQQISKTKYSNVIEPIIWKSNDEIGSLVTEYNAMLEQLNKSAALLAQAEKENAWKEMSKQVAHEIKNPLTPMKLNIQHLQRVVKINPNDVADRVDKVANMLIEQIDALANIANEFSNFAKFPTTKLEHINVVEVLQNVTNLFKKAKDRKIDLVVSTTEMYALIDKNQFLRAITNLVKNADQAIPEDKFGFIKIFATQIESNIVIKISDNGSGIPKELYSKLFTPNFTTKNSGTGLGLAMVKNSILTFNGTITFESEISAGTTFTITLPLISS